MRTNAIIEAIETVGIVLRDHDLGAQGAVLAQLLAQWLMDHNKDERASVLDLHLMLVRDSVARREKEEE